MKICANCKYYSDNKLGQPLCTKQVTTKIDIVTGKEYVHGYVYAEAFRRRDPFSKLYRKIGYLITKNPYWKETPCGPEAQYYEAMR